MQALYRKYRSKKLSELVGQEHVTTTLSNALKNGQINHAYLLTGPKGTGKTSIARILAHEINGLPYENDDSHLDIIEIDAASNRGIEEIRDLRDKTRLAPSSAKYKIYIIDEVHMLTTPAFNALLKTLEEPPQHVIFILATTELHKLPETIISRTQRYGFKPIGIETMIPHLRMIAEKESINIDDDALRLIAEHASGGFRDAISLLDQARSIGKKVDYNTVEDMIGLPPQKRVAVVVSNVINGDGREALSELNQLFDEGYQAGIIANQLISDARQRLISDSSNRQELINFLEAILESQLSANPNVALELAILSAAGDSDSAPKPKPLVPQPEKAEAKKPVESPPAEALETKVSTKKTIDEVPKSSSLDLWTDTLSAMKGTSNTLYGILRMAEATFSDDQLTLKFQFPFHMKRASESRHAKTVVDMLKKISGHDYTIAFEKLTIKAEKVKPAEKKPAKAQKETEADESVRNVLSVFGGGEIVN